VELASSADRDPAALLYARWLSAGSRLGLALLVLGFIAYATGIVDPHVPIERLPALWNRPAAEVLREVGLRPGWAWAELLHRSDMLILAGIGVLASCSIPCLAAVIPQFRAQRAMAFVWICAAEIAVLVLALSGLLASGH
jgi:hypothetical protein